MQTNLEVKCELVGVRIQQMIQAVMTWWLTQGTVLQHALELRPALDALCNEPNWNPVHNWKKCIQKYQLDEDQWSFLEQLEPMLIVSDSSCFINTIWFSIRCLPSPLSRCLHHKGHCYTKSFCYLIRSSTGLRTSSPMRSYSLVFVQLQFEAVRSFASITQRQMTLSCTGWPWVHCSLVTRCCSHGIASLTPRLQNGILPEHRVGAPMDWPLLWNCLGCLEAVLPTTNSCSCDNWDTGKYCFYNDNIILILFLEKR